MKKILLHVCCAPCAIYVVKRLQEENFEVTMFFYNPNIQPEAEYQRRKGEVERLSAKLDLDLITSPYKTEEWLMKVSGLEYEPEGGKRCRVCYDLRLSDTARYASLNEFDFFATTMTISPHKPAKVVNLVGREVTERINQEVEQGKTPGKKIEFLEADWKKHDGFKGLVKCRMPKGFTGRIIAGVCTAKKIKFCKFILKKVNKE